MFSIRIVVGIICSLPRPAYPGPSARVPGPVSPGMRDEIENRPFPLKIAKKMKCFQRHKWIRKQSYLVAFQTPIPDIPFKTEGGRWKIGVEDKWL